jgi:hypothetical protein
MRFTTATTSIVVLVGVVLVVSSVAASADPIVWNGPSITFAKPPGFADPTLRANQDRLTNNVWLTRGDVRQLFNIRIESGADTPESPLDTEWAFGPTQPGNPGPITASNHANLVFDAFVPALAHGVGDNILSFGPGVLHLISDDIYLDIKFTSWKIGGGGDFSYIRSTPLQSPVPEPTSAALLVTGATWVGMVAGRRTRKQTIASPRG